LQFSAIPRSDRTPRAIRRDPLPPNAVKIIVASAALVLGVNQASAAEEKMILLPSADAIKWGDPPPSLPKRTKFTVLAGDPGKPGPFVLRVYFPANSVVAPHTHATAENLTVISGELYHEMGEKLDKAGGDQLKAGAFVYLPALMPHSVWTKGEEAVVQVTGTGPFGLDYVNPADDPSKK
jgi:quercetin dioxygenase-like cupin family protein